MTGKMNTAGPQVLYWDSSFLENIEPITEWLEENNRTSHCVTIHLHWFHRDPEPFAHLATSVGLQDASPKIANHFVEIAKDMRLCIFAYHCDIAQPSKYACKKFEGSTTHWITPDRATHIYGRLVHASQSANKVENKCSHYTISISVDHKIAEADWDEEDTQNA